MSAFLDTGVLIGLVNRQDERHRDVVRLLDPLLEGAEGQLFTSDYVIAEGLNYIRARAPRKALAQELLNVVFGDARTPPLIPSVLKVHGTIFRSAIESYLGRWDAGLSLTDWTSLVLLREHGIEKMVTFDKGFDAWASVLR